MIFNLPISQDKYINIRCVCANISGNIIVLMEQINDPHASLLRNMVEDANSYNVHNKSFDIYSENRNSSGKTRIYIKGTSASTWLNKLIKPNLGITSLQGNDRLGISMPISEAWFRRFENKEFVVKVEGNNGIFFENLATNIFNVKNQLYVPVNQDEEVLKFKSNQGLVRGLKHLSWDEIKEING